MTIKIFKRSYVPLLVAGCFGLADAAPTLPQVVAGQASFSQQGNVFSITNTPGTIINWQSFSVNQGEVTRFIQQSADSAVLNRILGQDPTKILGALQSNGKVFLINPNGILFGRDARVDVNGLVASTLNMSNADFLAGKKNFTAAPGAGDVSNEGAITTPGGGQVFLVAPNVANSGIITSPKGDVVLAAGHSVQLVDSRDPDLQVVVSAPASQAINLGQLVAQGGKIGIFGALVNQRGLVSANSAVLGENGKIVLKASRDTVLEQGSVTSATGAGKGGDIHLLGERVGLAGNAAVDASGAAGGGTVLVGGDWQGKNALTPNARQTWFGKNASIKADATVNGDGGKVVLWSDGATSAFGNISARGGALGGNGGKVETSGHHLDITGVAVNAGAAKGKAGSWLLDPEDIEVVNTGTALVSDVNLFGGGPASGVTRISPAVLTPAGNTDIVLQASRDLTFTDALTAPSNVFATALRDIIVNAPVTSTNGKLVMRAGGNFTLGSGATLSSGSFVDLRADQMFLNNGHIGGVGGRLPVVSFSSSTLSRPIIAGSGAASAGSLWLDVDALSRISAYEINLGDGGHTGLLTINAGITHPANLVLDNAGPITINAPINLTGASSSFVASLYGANADSINISEGGSILAGKSILLEGDRLAIGGGVRAGSVTLRPHNDATVIELGGSSDGVLSIGQSALNHIAARDELTIGGKPGRDGMLKVTGTVDLSQMAGVPSKLTLDAGDAELEINAALKTPNTVALKSTLLIHQDNEVGAVTAGSLAVTGGQVDLTGNNKIATLAGSSDSEFHVHALDGYTIGTAGGMNGISAPLVELISANGAVTVGQAIQGAVHVNIDAIGIGGSGTIKSNSVHLRSRNAGIGAASAPLNTETSVLWAISEQQGGQPINIRNQGDLMLVTATQLAVETGANTGSITIDNVGRLTVPTDITVESAREYPHEGVQTGSGDISLVGRNGLTVTGEVNSASGNIRLVADNGSRFTTTEGSRVMAGAGDIFVVAGSTAIAEGTLLASTTAKIHLPGANPPPTPTLDSCIANPAQPGCAAVVEAARRACIANPNGPECAKVLPPVNECKTNPAGLGCDLVLERDKVLQCSINPNGAGCDSAYGVCVAKPSTPGCDAVVRQREQLNACIANPKASGCKDVLPRYEACSANPSTLGCAPVIEERKKIEACIADPKGANCASVLPPLEVCRNNGNEFGCAPVLRRAAFDACLVNPSGPGCDAILPPLTTCKATPGEEGCSQVMKKTFNFCLTNPNDARCEGVLPTISQCVLEKSRDGCAVVLPTMTQCIGSPSLQGCTVILPKLEQCAVNPTMQGCEAVLPKPSFCSTHPTDPSCLVFNPGAGSSNDSQAAPVSKAVQSTVNLINGGTGGSGAGSGSASNSSSGPTKPSDQHAGPVPSENSGAKNEKPATKMYCN